MPHESAPLRVYISGPIRGIPGGNGPAFIEAEKVLRRQGYEPVNPKGVHPRGTPWADCIPADLESIKTCQKVVMLDGWECSYGATIEALYALGAGIGFINNAHVYPFSSVRPEYFLPSALPIDHPKKLLDEASPGPGVELTSEFQELDAKGIPYRLMAVGGTVSARDARSMLNDETLHYSDGKSGVDQIPVEPLMDLGDVYAYGEKKYSQDLPVDAALEQLVTFCSCGTVNFTQLARLSHEACVEVATTNGLKATTPSMLQGNVPTLIGGTEKTYSGSETTNRNTVYGNRHPMLLDDGTLQSMVLVRTITNGSTIFNGDNVRYAVRNQLFSAWIMTIFRDVYGVSSADHAISDSVCSEIISRVFRLHSPTCNAVQKSRPNGPALHITGRDNWKRGTTYHEFYGSALRHLFKFWRGEWLDEESHLPHLAHAMWNICTLSWYFQNKKGIDDRDID